MVRVSRRLAVIVALLGLLPISPHGDAASPRRWYVAISGPTRVAADRDYSYTVVVTNDGGVWTTSAKARSFFRLAFDLTERYGEGTVGVSDILVHPTGPPAADGALPCAVHRGCSFTRVGSRVDFLFTKEDVTIPPMAFDVVVHTASVFRVGDAIAVSAGLQSGWMPPYRYSMDPRPRIRSRVLRGRRSSRSIRRPAMAEGTLRDHPAAVTVVRVRSRSDDRAAR